MAIIETKKLPEHGYKLIFMPEERLNGLKMCDVTVVNSENNSYRMQSWYEFRRGELIPHGLMYMALGSIHDLWAHFPDSNFIYFIIGEKLV